MTSSNVSYTVVTGWPKDIKTMLISSLSAYTRQGEVESFKIGITNDPEGRFFKAYADKYNKMIVLYKTDSIANVSELEKILVAHNWELADNKRGGGAGNIGMPPYYLYVVLT